MEARFTINAIPALAALDRGKAGNGADPTVGMWEFLNTDRWTMLGKAPRGRRSRIARSEDSPVNGTPAPFFRLMSDS